MSAPDDLIGDLIAEVARCHGVAISRDDPVVAVVLLNQVVLRRYLEDTVAPAAAAIRSATQDALGQVERFAEAQAHWLEQVSLKDRAAFLEDQKALHQSWKTDMQGLIEGQNGALQKVVLQTAAMLRAQATSPTEAGPLAGAAALPAPTPVTPVRSWGWLWAGMLLGMGTTVAVTVGAVLGMRLAGP